MNNTTDFREREKTERRAHIVCSSFDLLVEFVLVLVPERRVSNQKDVEDHTYTHKTQPLSE